MGIQLGGLILTNIILLSETMHGRVEN
jgi:hypothetical protein